MQFIDINKFIKDQVVFRQESLFSKDITDNEAILKERITDKKILVIGGGGTIGSSYIRAILAYRPKKLYVVDTDENRLTELTRFLRSQNSYPVPTDYKTYPMSYNSEVFFKMLKKEGPFDIVAHFAAHKHVRSEKDQYSIHALLQNNIFSTVDLLKHIEPTDDFRFFCVSTDKAASPVNVMGASKKLMEEAIMSYAGDFTISTARFANVAFSNGSLLDGYQRRLSFRQPISCPSDVKRFFVSPDESGQLCMLANILGNTGEIFFPKLDESHLITFKAITERYFDYIGWGIDYCQSEQEAREKAEKWSSGDPYPVYFFKTDTSGEKLYEEFYTPEDAYDLNRFQELGVITNAIQPKKQEVSMLINELKGVLKGDCSKDDIVKCMQKHLPGFDHIETGKSLDDRM